ncbi:hypothetical protein ACFO5R_13335 [Halosolutus amylolyticus]|uniref:Uncharacterized protein n=1 Tax=Halosolutus amylolyticus TaxID=2932267 RepID=A0ABD5PQS3_9EURY|nr:hypothetical protein [Halosolutus amylolyticus]
MTTDRGTSLTVAEFVEYCRTQAGLLSGHVERMGDEARELLDEIDAEMAEIRSRLEGGGVDVGGTQGPSTATRPNERDVDLESIEELERDLSEKQTLVDAKQARMQAFQDLAAGYTDLAERLQDDVEDGQEALTRVVEFEADHDAPAYFDERQTLCEAAIEAESSDPE